MRKRLHCSSCEKVCWATHKTGFYYNCKECGDAINYWEAKRIESKNRKSARKTRAKDLGIYESDEARRLRKRVSRRGEPDPMYMEWIKTLGCIVCNKKPCDAHHMVLKSQGGHDQTCIPLCKRHHQTGADSIHGLGSVEAFEKCHGINLAEGLRLLHQEYLRKHPERTLHPTHDLLNHRQELH